MPPMIAPSGIVPHTMNRIVAFIRPCIRGGVIAWRSDTWLMFQRDAEEPADEPEQRQGREDQLVRARARPGRPDRLKPTADSTSIRPTPTRAVIRLVTSAASSTPTDPIENANPIPSGLRPRSRVDVQDQDRAHRRCRRSSRSPVVAAIARSQRCPVT